MLSALGVSYGRTQIVVGVGKARELEELRPVFLQGALGPVSVVSLSGTGWTSLKHGRIKAVGLLT